jgi:hypothetical protein
MPHCSNEPDACSNVMLITTDMAQSQLAERASLNPLENTENWAHAGGTETAEKRRFGH